MKNDFIALSVPFFFLFIFLELFYGKWKNEHYYRLNDTLTNLSCGIGQQILGLWLKFYFIFLMAFFYQYRLFTIPNTWYYAILLFLGVDLCYYWFHRLSHEINAMWATHVVHHQSEEYNLSVALRQSWFQTIFSSSFYIPLPFLGFDPALIASIIAINTLYQFWIHTKVIKKMPAVVEFIFNTPSHHRVHHGKNPKYIDKNHAGSLIIWDRMFGTFQKEEEEVIYGITTPLNSWNPIWANLHYWKDISRISWLSKKLKEKIKAFFAAPGWQPDHLGGFQHPKEIDKNTYHKFDTLVSKRLSVYLILQYVFIVGLTSYFMFFGKPFVDAEVTRIVVIRTIYIAAYIILAITSIGFLLQHKRLGIYLEYLRIICLGCLGLLFLNETYAVLANLITGGLCLISLIHFTILVSAKEPTLIEA